MAIRSDIRVDYSDHPRLTIVEYPSTQLLQTDNVDTLRNIEAQPQNSDDEVLLEVEGGGDLSGDGSVLVGLTVYYLDNLLVFEPRQASIVSGAITTEDTAGMFLNDSTAQFVTDQVQPGAHIVNFTDRSVTTVIQVMSETQLRCFPLGNGTDNQFGLNDEYKVWNIDVCEATGGNLVGLDINDQSVVPVLPTWGVQIVRTTSQSATIAELEIENLQRLVEMLRNSHVGMGNVWYWDPYAGSDLNDGKKPNRPVKTFAKAHDLAVADNHDIIFCQPGASGGATVADETLVVSKNQVMVRGPGTDFVIRPTTTTNPTVLITGEGCEVSGLQITTAPTGGQAAVEVASDWALLRNLHIHDPHGIGISVHDSANTLVDNIHMTEPDVGFYIGDNVDELDLKNCQVHDADSHGFHIAGTNISFTKIRGKGTSASGCGGYGINVGTGALSTLLDSDGTVDNNALGNILDEGADTNYSGLDKRAAYQGAVWYDSNSAVTGTNYPRGTPGFPVNNEADMRAIADEQGLTRINFSGTLMLTQSYVNWQIVGYSAFTVDTVILNGQDVTGTYFWRCTATGAMTGAWANFQESLVVNVSGLFAVLVNCGIQGTLTMPVGGQLLGSRCNSIGGTVFDMGGAGAGTYVGLAVDGVMEVRNLDTGSVFDTGHNFGRITIDSSCVGGNVDVGGRIEVTNNAGPGCSVVNNAAPYTDWAYDITEVANGPNSAAMSLRRALGLMQENTRIDNFEYDGDSGLTKSRVRLFASKADAEASTIGGTSPPDPEPIATFTQTSAWVPGESPAEATSYLQVLEP